MKRRIIITSTTGHISLEHDNIEHTENQYTLVLGSEDEGYRTMAVSEDELRELRIMIDEMLETNHKQDW